MKKLKNFWGGKMELTAYFDDFTKKVVNINASRLEKLKEKIDVIKRFVKENDLLKDFIIELVPQGSYRHKTIIKPAKDNKEFDADVLIQMKLNNEWEYKEYIENIYSEFRGNNNFRDIVHRKTRCVTLDYKSDFHIDLVPLLEINQEFFITNRISNEIEKTNPFEYTEWLLEKNNCAKNHLIKVIRLFKYLRDIKENFQVKSILLNTLLGTRIEGHENVEDFRNLPTALFTTFNRLNNFLQNNPLMPTINNPTLSSENFNRHWDQGIYENFRNKIKLYCEKVTDAFNETEKEKSIEKWKGVFGDKFPGGLEKNGKYENLHYTAAGSRPWCY